MTRSDAAPYDFAVIGTGPAGQKAAIQAAKLGKKVVAIERRATVGGGAVATGTIPSKTLREAVLYLTGIRQRELYGVSYRLKPDIGIQDLLLRVDYVFRREVQVIEDQLRRNGVELIHGVATFADAHTLIVSTDDAETKIATDRVMIGTGSGAARHPEIPIDGVRTFDTENIFTLNDIPKSLIIVGGGVIGMEYASIFAALGVEVTLIEKNDMVLDFIDEEIVDALVYHMRQNEVTFRLGEEVSSVEVGEKSVVARTVSNKRITSERLLYTVGRQAATEGLNLETVGVEADSRGRISVDDQFRTTVPNIYAAGDVIGFPALATTSQRQGRIAARCAFGAPDRRRQEPLPFGIYAVPEISMIGPTEKTLTDSAVPYEVGIAEYDETARGAIIGDSTGRLKMLVHADDRKLLGVHIIGEGAAELIHIGQAVIAFGGTIDYFINNVFNYPTLAETYRIAALDVDNKLSTG